MIIFHFFQWLDYKLFHETNNLYKNLKILHQFFNNIVLTLLTIASYGAQQEIVSKNANMKGPNTILGAFILHLIYLVISLINDECTLAKSSKRNNTVLSASNNSFFSLTSRMSTKYTDFKLNTYYDLYVNLKSKQRNLIQ